MRTFSAFALVLLFPVLASGQITLISGYNFGQFLFPGTGAVDGDTIADGGSIGSNWTSTSSPALETSGDYVFGNGLSGNYSTGSGRVYWDGTAGSSLLLGAGVVRSSDVGANAINAFTVAGTNIALLGDWGGGAGAALSVTSVASIGFVQDTLNFADYSGSIGNLTFAAQAIGAPVNIDWSFSGSIIATTTVSSTAMTAYSVDLPEAFYNLSAAELTATFSGGINLDNVQFNGVVAGSTPPASGTYWKGGTGIWTAAGTPTNWRDSAGTAQSAWDSTNANFRSVTGETPGAVTVEGTVVFTGIRFDTSGYTIAPATGGTLSTSTASTPIQVTTGVTATISAPITGTGGINKTDTGTLTLSGANTYAGATTVTAGTLQVNGSQSGAVSVLANGTLGGTGTVGSTTVATDGTLTGAAGSVFTMSGLTLASSSILDVTLGAPSTSALFQVNGPLTLDGLLNVSGTAGFGAGVYRLFNYTGTLTNNTLVAGSVPAGFAATDIQTSVANQVNVVFSTSTSGGAPRPIWAGGSGTWSASGSSSSWGNVGGSDTGGWNGGMAIFQGTPGTVTVSTSSGAVIFNGLQLASDGYTISGGALTTNTAATPLRVGDGTSAGAGMTGTISSAIAGTGGVNKTDLGRVILSGANTYTGGTTITAGTLQIGAGGTTGSVTGNIVNNATLALNRSDATTLAGSISGTGALVHQGAGTTTLTGTNTYTGGTTISAGTLQIGAGGAIGTIGAGSVVNNGTLAVSRSDAITVGNTISGTGNLVKQGAGTLTLTGSNLYAGGTTVSGGVLEVSDNGNLGATTGNLTLNGGTLRTGAGFTSARNVTLGAAGGTLDTGANTLVLQGAVSGTGALTKTGTGTLTLSGTNSYTGATTLSAGTILLNNSSLGATTIAASGKLSGVGSIRGNLANSGTLSPGSSPGTLSITGNFSQAASGNTLIELASATVFDRLVITGTASLGGTLTVSGVDGFVPAGGQAFKFLEAAGGVTGTFATIVSPTGLSSPMLRFEALYHPKDVTLSLSQLPFGGLDGTPDQIALGESLDGAIAEGTIPNLQAALNRLPTVEKVKTAMNELSPQRYDRWFDQAVYSSNATVRTIESRLEQALREPRGSLWSEVVRRESRFDATAQKTRANGSANGILVGGDARVLPDLQFGMVFGYTNERLDLDENGSATDVKRVTGSVYGRYDLSPWFVEGVLGASHASLDSRRTINLPGYLQLAQSGNDSSEVYGNLRGGYAFLLGRTRLTPYAGVNYVNWSADAANETGANEANLKVSSQSRSSLSSRAGVTVTFPFMGENISFIPKFDLSWRHEFRDGQRTLMGEIGGSPFTLEGSSPALGGILGTGANGGGDESKRNGLVAGFGVDVTFGARLTAYLRISSEWSTAVDKAIEARAGTELRF